MIQLHQYLSNLGPFNASKTSFVAVSKSLLQLEQSHLNLPLWLFPLSPLM